MVGEAPTEGNVKSPSTERLPRLRAVLRRLGLGERGTAMVEFALIAPVLFFLIFGVLDFSLALNDYNQESQLVGLGARAAAVNRNPDGTSVSGNSIQTQLQSNYAQGNLKNNVSVCITLPNGAAAGQPVKVVATYQFHLLPIFSATGVASTIQIQASQTERQETAFSGTTSATCP
jgi:Flp pilus assembly protein TadG